MNIEKDQEQPAKKVLDAEQEQQLADLERLTGEDYSPPDPGTGVAVQERDTGPDLDTSQMCASVVSVVFTLVAGRRGDHWNLSADESQQLGGALAAVLDKYAPQLKGGPEATLVLVALMIAGPRAMQDAKIREQQLQQEADNPKDRDAEKPAPAPVADKGWVQDKA